MKESRIAQFFLRAGADRFGAGGAKYCDAHHSWAATACIFVAVLACIFCPTQSSALIEGQAKFIAVNNDGVTPVQVRTGRGSFLLSGIDLTTASLIFTIDHWKDLMGRRPTWFTDTQQSKLVGTGAGTSAKQGTSVAMSADGNTLAEGGPLDNSAGSSTGAVWIFTRSGTSWTPQGGKLIGTVAASGQAQGTSVALSADGNTLAVGGPGDSGGIGAVWIWTRTGTSWGPTGGIKLTPNGVSGGIADFGASVSLSANGNTLAIGGYGDAINNGAVWIFTNTNGIWTQQGSKLTPSDENGAGQFGASVALSADGNTLAVGGPADATNNGAAWIFTRLASSLWVQQGSKLVGNDAIASAPLPQQGRSVALSADGNTLAVGGPRDNSNQGAVWIYKRSNGVWTQQGSKLIHLDVSPTSSLGYAVVLSADGNTLVAGGANIVGYGVWIFVNRAGLWSQMGGRLAGTGSSPGFSVATSADANTIGGGGPTDSSNAGAVWVFV